MSQPVTHGLASSIRDATESETFDLGGLGPDTIQNVVEHAMNEPFALSEMIRITLVVGAGKQSRQKYNAGAMKVVTSTLQNTCGFTEDRGASCVLECQGMYKVQHDTGKNLKTVVIFPKIVPDKSGDASASTSGEGGSSLLFPKSSMEYKVAASSLSVFRNMVQAKCPTWSEKKTLLQLIEQDLVEKIISPVDDLLMRGQRVPEDLQNYYDNVMVEISQKQQFVKETMHNQVDASDLTQLEVDHLLEQVQHRISTGNDNPKALAKAKERLQKLTSISPSSHANLKHHAELGRLWKQVNNIKIPDTTGRLLSVHESQLIGKRDELLEEIDQLERASQGWLEDDHIFEMRLHQCRSEFDKKFSKNNTGSGKKGSKQNMSTMGASTKARTPVTKWVTPGETKAQAMSKKKTKAKKGSLFSAMMADSSSDEEEEEEEINEETEDIPSKQQTTETADVQQKTTETTSNAQLQSTNSKKKRSKKKKGKTDSKTSNVAVEANSQEDISRKVQASESVPMAFINVILAILSWVLSLILAILRWVLSLIFGGESKKRKKK
jgi:hypothetical protein